jgi:hypothetical protein
VLPEIKNHYWHYIVNEDFMLQYFFDLNFLKREIVGIRNLNLLCVVRDPDEAPPTHFDDAFRFLGYDLVDHQNSASALCNCGGFPDVFANEELSSVGLLTEYARAREVQEKLKQRHPKEFHADCYLWAIFRNEHR